MITSGFVVTKQVFSVIIPYAHDFIFWRFTPITLNDDFSFWHLPILEVHIFIWMFCYFNDVVVIFLTFKFFTSIQLFKVSQMFFRSISLVFAWMTVSSCGVGVKIFYRWRTLLRKFAIPFPKFSATYLLLSAGVLCVLLLLFNILTNLYPLQNIHWSGWSIRVNKLVWFVLSAMSNRF